MESLLTSAFTLGPPAQGKGGFFVCCSARPKYPVTIMLAVAPWTTACFTAMGHPIGATSGVPRSRRNENDHDRLGTRLLAATRQMAVGLN